MTALTPDPLGEGGIARFVARYRLGEITSVEATRAYLDRIAALDGKLGAFEHVAAEQALATAEAMDRLRAAGVDLGPLMGVPVAVKDLLVVDGMPTTAGSRVEIGHLLPDEGPFVRALRRSGCVILGKTKMVEFALGITGASSPRGTPWNPWDAAVHRLPGGSSSGSAVAMAAGLCAFAIGSDTGGSVRAPAALCGVYGLKTSFGLWPTEGAFPLAPHLDSIGLLTRSAEDAALVYAQMPGGAPVRPAPLAGLRLGRLDAYFFGGIEPQVEQAVGTALDRLQAAGVRLDPVEVPEAPERQAYFPAVLPACLVGILGKDAFLAGRSRMDPVVGARAEAGLEVRAHDCFALEERRRRSRASVKARFEGVDAWVSPTVATPAPPLDDLADPDKAMKMALEMTRNTQPANYLDLPSASLPLLPSGGRLPVGLQVMCPNGEDARVLAISLAIEKELGTLQGPPVEGFR